MPKFETMYTAPGIDPYLYPLAGGFPYLNLAKWFGVPYQLVMDIVEGNVRGWDDEIMRAFMFVQNRETKRSNGVYGSMPYGV